MTRFEKAFKFTEENEGGFINDPRDKGGATIFGISSKWFPDVYNEVINEKDPEKRHTIVENFYFEEFWNKKYDLFFSEPLAIRLFDLSVNLGKSKAVKLLQSTFNDLSQVKIPEDGKFGDGTLRAVNLPPIGHNEFYQSYKKKAEQYYRSLADFNVFGKGWLNRLNREA